MKTPLRALSSLGVSIWLDDLSRERIETGNLASMISDWSVVGVTTNPAIFQSALAQGARYDAHIAELVQRGLTVAEVATAAEELVTTDVRNACDILRPVYDATHTIDGRVSIEVTPDLANDAAGTHAQAQRLWETVDRPNLFIKIPATPAGYQAIAATLAEGISVNVTLIFGLDQYRSVMSAYLDGLEQAAAKGQDLSTIHSVASFFVSRVDTEIDTRLDALGYPDLKGRAGIANARLGYQAFEDFFRSDRWTNLANRGARLQRPLWASTGVKNPDYDDTMYVVDLAVANSVNTMPEPTLRAVADHGHINGDQIHAHYTDAAAHLAALADAGVVYDDVIATLLAEGIEKFNVAWNHVIAAVTQGIHNAQSAAHG